MSTPIKLYRIALLICLLSLNACTDKDADTSEQKTAAAQPEHHKDEEVPTDIVELTDDQLRIASVQLGQVEYRNLGQLLNLNGRLAVPAQSQVNITALQGGFVRSIPLLPGQPVRKGQLLARVENPDLIGVQQEYAETHSRLTYLEAEFTRQQELSRENVSALKVLQQTTADLNATRARVTGLAQRIRLVGLSPQSALAGRFSATYVITAPVAGVVTDVPATAGQYVQSADVIARLTSSQGLYAELTVFEKDLPQLREGQRVSILLNNEGGKERAGRILYINRAIDADRSVRVVAKLDRPDARLSPNTSLRASLDLGDSRVTALPEAAIVSAEDKDYIFVETDEKAAEHQEHEAKENEHPAEKPDKAGPSARFKQIPVRRGVTEGGYSQVTLPASLNLTKARVVVKGAYALLSQLKAAGGEEEHAH
ncbi:efflux RND transporter periplasmic adaptor subunit [Spirosoma fluviale]|uniref:Membrane fusion protein, cobalt-zinc-cadmium efflux system n=1 Tax=Spirosoma fluviale TaxID=1597977 RepID=A0A286GI21_9BACT|nr:efflux RND transporter periplasmic adaptor subunit [Spirosoma fluviale]SOD95187.1 membrane fusion protein, cobalt-zinc-cadmium efflux system [Spirosoma fluviale]